MTSSPTALEATRKMSRHSWRAAGSRLLSIRVPRRVCMRRARALLPLIDGKTRIPSGPGSTHDDDMYGVEMRIEWALEQEESPRLISGHKGTYTNIPPLFLSVKIRNAWRWFSLTLANISEDAGSAQTILTVQDYPNHPLRPNTLGKGPSEWIFRRALNAARPYQNLCIEAC